MNPIEYFYAGYSGYAYLGSRRFMEIANAAGRPIRHRRSGTDLCGNDCSQCRTVVAISPRG